MTIKQSLNSASFWCTALQTALEHAQDSHDAGLDSGVSMSTRYNLFHALECIESASTVVKAAIKRIDNQESCVATAVENAIDAINRNGYRSRIAVGAMRKAIKAIDKANNNA